MVSTPLGIVALLVIAMFLGLGLLYAYRAQTPAVQTVPLTQAMTEIREGRVDQILLENERVTLTLYDGSRQQTNTGGSRDALSQAVTDWNRANPAKNIQLRYDDRNPFGQTLFSILLGFLPLAVLIALIVLAGYAFARARAPDPYERLARLADLRDRAVLTEDEFQREKRKILGQSAT
jgi:ATP-dependent Zn protease